MNRVKYLVPRRPSGGVRCQLVVGTPAPSRSTTMRNTIREADDIASRAMERYAGGDDSAFEILYDSIAPRVHAYLWRQTRDASAADDLLQRTLLQIHRYRASYVAGAPLLPWAFAIARRLIIDEFRRRKSDALHGARVVADGDGMAASPDEALRFRQIAALLEAELSRIPETQRIAFKLVRVDGLSHEEAARVLGITVNAVKLRAFRAYSAIRAVLGTAPGV